MKNLMQQSDGKNALESADFSAAVLAVIHQFDAKTKDVLLYRLFAGLSYRQISELLKISEESARVIFSRGKARLKKELIREGFEV